MDDLSQARGRRFAARATIERGHRVGDGAERVAQLVRHRGEEFVLGATVLGALAIELRVFQEDAGEIADALQEAHLPFRERAPRRPPDDEEAADGSILDPDRHEEVGLVRELPENLRVDARVTGHVVGPHGAAVCPRLLDRRVIPDGNRNPAKGVDHLGRHVIAGDRREFRACRIGQVRADHVGSERQGDLARHPPHRLDGIQRRGERPAHRQQRLGLAQT